MLHIPVFADRHPIIKHKQALHVLFSIDGLWREAFWLKVSKKGDLYTRPMVRMNVVKRGTAKHQGDRVNLGSQFCIEAQGAAARKRDHLSFHPAADKPGKESPVFHGMPGQMTKIALDLRKISRRHVVMVHRLAEPSRYPLSDGGDAAVRFGNLSFGRGVPEFHLFVTPLSGPEPLDQPVPFVPGVSADFVSEPVRGSNRHLLFQLRLGYCQDSSVSDHVLLVPQF